MYSYSWKQYKDRFHRCVLQRQDPDTYRTRPGDKTHKRLKNNTMDPEFPGPFTLNLHWTGPDQIHHNDQYKSKLEAMPIGQLCSALPDVDRCSDIGFLARPREEQHTRSSAWQRIKQFLFFSYTKMLRVAERWRVTDHALKSKIKEEWVKVLLNCVRI